MLCGECWYAAVYFVTGVIHTKRPRIRYRVTLFGYPDRQAGTKTSSCVKSYKSVEVYDDNAQEFAIDSIIHSHMNVIQKRA